MKLNLIPTSVKGAKKSQFAWVGALVIAALGVAGMVGLTLMSSQALTEAKQKEADLRPQVERAVAISNQADEVIAQAQGIIRNSALSAALIKHNTVLLDAPPLHAAWRAIGQRTPSAKNTAGNFQRPRSTDPHHSQRAGSGRGGKGGNGVRTGHQRTATRAPRSTSPSASSSRRAAMNALFWGMVPTETRIHSGRP